MREALRARDEELKTLRTPCEESHEKRSQIEVELVRKQAELKFLDETSRKELNCPVEELAAADDPIPESDGDRRGRSRRATKCAARSKVWAR